MATVASDISDVLVDCYRDFSLFCKVMFPERFSLPFGEGHRQIFEAIEGDAPLVAIQAHRGCGKSSIFNLALPARNLLYQDSKFVVPVSCTASQAILQAENLKRELTTNTSIQSIFGDIRYKEAFSKDQWVVAWDGAPGAMVLPRGSGQQVRGIIFQNSRPDLIIVDDLEDPEAVLNEESRRKLKSWFYGDLLGSLNLSEKGWRVLVIGTLLHEDSLLANLMEDPNWEHINVPLADEQFHSTWPEYISDDGVEQLMEKYRDAGELHTFYMEYMNEVVPGDEAAFTEDCFDYYQEPELDSGLLESVVILDPAKSVTSTADESGLVAASLDKAKGCVYIREALGVKKHPNEVIDLAITMALRWGARVLAVEVTSLNEFIVYPIQNEILRKGINLELVQLKPRQKKEDRVKALVPLYRKGLVKHNRASCQKLEKQLLSFPRSKNWDVMDACAYTIELFELGGRYMTGTRGREIPDETEFEGLMGNSFADELGSNWRIT